MRRLTPALFLTLALAASASFAQAQLTLPRVSPKATVSQTIGLTDLTVVYSRPGVKGRTIWGELVPYQKPWRTGANEATTFTTTHDIRFGGQTLPAGTYSLLTVPTAEGWAVMLNTEKDLWGANGYKTEKDLLKTQIKPTAAAEPSEWMQFTFENLTPASADLVLRWEKLRLAIPIQVEVNERALASARSEIAKLKADDWRTLYRAADFAFNNAVALDEGQQWLQKSLSIEKNYLNLSLLAKWQMKDGKKKDAVATAKKAIAAGKASKEPMDTAATEKLLSDWTGDS